MTTYWPSSPRTPIKRLEKTLLLQLRPVAARYCSLLASANGVEGETLSWIGSESDAMTRSMSDDEWAEAQRWLKKNPA